ncbi:hypothetical protein C8J57DRAFT_1364321, partial [Mycena rebaudengoi]
PRPPAQHARLPRRVLRRLQRHAGQDPPARYERAVSTRRSASIKFGRVEIRAKLPTGDWLWPALWMLPVDDAYGGWPLS